MRAEARAPLLSSLLDFPMMNGWMKSNRTLLVVLSLCIASAACAASDASTQALALYKAIQKQNWKALYYLAQFSPAIQKQLPGADEFAKQVAQGVRSSGNAAVVDTLFKGMKNIRVGTAAVSGNKATVPTAVTVNLNGKVMPFKGLARMIKSNGAWKWDLTGTDDAQKATSVAIQELIGKPVK
jgi:hypothetical protein